MKPKVTTTDTNQLTSFQKKRQVNLRWNHTRNFQLGLILSILFVIIAVETIRVEIKDIPLSIEQDLDDDIFTVTNYIIEKPQVKVEPVATVTPPRRITEVVKVVENDISNSSLPTIETEPPKIEVDPGKTVVLVTPKEEKPPAVMDLNAVSQIPVFPGCNAGADRAEQIDCFTKMTHKFIIRRFDYDIGVEENLSGRIRIYGQFTVDVTGQITDVRINTANEALKKEAERVIRLLPEMQPGMQNGKVVPVKFNVPIVFQVKD